MPYNRPGPGVYVVNGGSAIQHGTAQANSGFVGVAVKHAARSWQDGYSIQAQIDASEPYYLITKGVVQVADPGLSSPAKGDAVYITAATGVITKTSGGNVKYGRIVELTGVRGVPTGKVRIDLDTKDSF